MGRPEIHTVEYFPFYVKDGRTLYALQKRFGLEGIGFFTNLFRFLSQTPDHWYCLQDEYDRMRFYERIGVEEERGEAMIEAMVATGKLDRELWRTRRVVASQDFQEKIEKAYESRTNKPPEIEEIRKLASAQYGEYSGGIPPLTPENPGNPPDYPLREEKRKEEKNKTLRGAKSAPEGSVALAPAAVPPQGISPPALPDETEELYAGLKTYFESKQPDGRFTDYGKEGKALHGLISKARARDPTDPRGFLKVVCGTFSRLKASGDKFWRGQPFLPSALNASGIFDRVIEEARGAMQSADVSWVDQYLPEEVSA
jgi:hypothetical protein